MTAYIKNDTDDKEDDECVIPGDSDVAGSAPQLSVKKVDFGCYWQLGLEPLSVMERHIQQIQILLSDNQN